MNQFVCMYMYLSVEWIAKNIYKRSRETLQNVDFYFVIVKTKKYKFSYINSMLNM